MTADLTLGLPNDPAEMASEMPADQMELLLGDDRPKIDYSKPEFSYNAERLWRDRPDVAKAACKLLAEPREVMPYRRIMKRLHMSYHLLRHLEIQSATTISSLKQTLASLSASVTEASMVRAMELLPKVTSAKDAMIMAGIAGDKTLQFAGEATQRIELKATVDFRGELRKLQEEAMARLEEMKRATVVEVRPAQLEGA